MSRSIYIVRLVQQIPGLDGYDTLLANYWSAVKAQLERQAMYASGINRLFIETVIGRGEDASVQLQQINSPAHSLVMNFVAQGAIIEEFEDRELLAELIDWGQCASQNLASTKVRNIVSNGQMEAAGARDEHLRKRLNDVIQDDESALVLAVSGQVPLPDRVEQFIVSPPELDQLERWLRTKMEEARREMMARMEREAAGQQSSSSGLWTPP